MAEPKSITSPSKVCRICLSPNDLNKSIFSYSHENKTLAKSIMDYVPIQILINDGLPILICDTCSDTLESFVRLCERCLTSDKILRGHFLNDNINDENNVSIKSENDSEDSRENHFYIDNFENCSLSENVINSEKWYDYQKIFIKDANKSPIPKQESKVRKRNIKVKKATTKVKKGKLKTYQYQCEFCGKQLPQKGHYDIHIRIHTGERPFKCNVCQKSFAHKATLKRHSIIHCGERPFSCEKCGKSFTQKNNLLTHMIRHTGEQRFKCEICLKKFSQKGQLIIHTRVHSGEKPYECTVCNKRFTRKHGLKIHEIIHLDKKPFKCPTCSKFFARKDCYNLHIKVHTGEKPFACQTCGKLFGRKDKLTLHSKTHSNNNKKMLVLNDKN